MPLSQAIIIIIIIITSFI